MASGITNTNNFICTQLSGFKNRFKYSKWLNSSIWPIDGSLTGTTTLGQSGPGSNGNEGVLHIPQTPRLELHYLM